MNRVLVPYEVNAAQDGRDQVNHLAIEAAYFAVELAKRTGATVAILRIQEGRPGQDIDSSPSFPKTKTDQALERLIQQSLQAGVSVESYITAGTFAERVSAFVEEHHVSRIVVALPSEESAAFGRISEKVTALREKVNCVLVTVRPRIPQEIGPFSDDWRSEQ